MTTTTAPNTIEFDTPIKRGSKTIDAITLRKPNSGELRGLSLSELMQLDVNSLQKVIPRISTPTLTEQDVQQMDPADLLKTGTLVAGFLLPKEVMESASPTA